MPPYYHNSTIEVCVGDHVEFKTWIEFWKGWIHGRVEYVPGRSPVNEELKHDGLTWVGIGYGKGRQTGVIVMPETQRLHNTVRFMRRSDDGFLETPKDYYFGD